jgi:queuine tRNA-ribosyltransferase
VGRIHTPHGIIDTPSFVAVGTNATLKALDTAAVDAMGLQLMFCNTYHLMLQPGTEIIKQAGGLHKFMNRTMPLITDSGGFQVFSLAYGTVKDELKSKGTKKIDNSVIKIDEEGVLFRSYRDGAKILLTPETSVQAQKDIGADIIIPFDELPPYHITPEKLKASLERTHRWEQRSLEYHLRNQNNQAMYSVVHGGVDADMRKKSAEFLSSLPFDGHAIGGSLGKNHQEMFIMLRALMPHLAPELPKHLLGIGDISSLQECVTFGLDTFDSSHPTRCARHGLLFTTQGAVKLMNASNKTDFNPIDKSCTCWTCQHYSRAYLHHLFKAREITGLVLATIHNLHFMVRLMEHYRNEIMNDRI